jgi:DNA end-binding protein Ku
VLVVELTLGTNLIEQMSGEFDPENYEDEYRLRLLAMLEESAKAGRSQLRRPRNLAAARSSISCRR